MVWVVLSFFQCSFPLVLELLLYCPRTQFLNHFLFTDGRDLTQDQPPKGKWLFTLPSPLIHLSTFYLWSSYICGLMGKCFFKFPAVPSLFPLKAAGGCHWVQDQSSLNLLIFQTLPYSVCSALYNTAKVSSGTWWHNATISWISEVPQEQSRDSQMCLFSIHT